MPMPMPFFTSSRLRRAWRGPNLGFDLRKDGTSEVPSWVRRFRVGLFETMAWMSSMEAQLRLYIFGDLPHLL